MYKKNQKYLVLFTQQKCTKEPKIVGVIHTKIKIYYNMIIKRNIMYQIQ